jgi:hypothetical protein
VRTSSEGPDFLVRSSSTPSSVQTRRDENTGLRRDAMRSQNLAGTTRLELATSAVTGQRSNQLNYVPTLKTQDFAEIRFRCGLCEKCIDCDAGKKYVHWWRFLDEPPPNRLQIFCAVAITNTMLAQCKNYAR